MPSSATRYLSLGIPVEGLMREVGRQTPEYYKGGGRWQADPHLYRYTFGGDPEGRDLDETEAFELMRTLDARWGNRRGRGTARRDSPTRQDRSGPQ